MLKPITVSALLLIPSLSTAAPRRAPPPSQDAIGVGAVVGSPTGLSAKYRLAPTGSIDAVLAPSSGFPNGYGPMGSGFYFHADYLYEGSPIARGKASNIGWFAGGGARMSYDSWSTTTTSGKGKNKSTVTRTHGETGLGVRVPAGLELKLHSVPQLELFGEGALDVGVANSRGITPELGLGARWYF